MKILYHHRTYAADGQEIHVRALQRALVAEGHEVREVALAPKGVGRKEAANPLESGRRRGLIDRAVALPLPLRELAEYAYTAVGIHRLRSAQKEFQADFIYERYAFGNAAGALAARRLGVPLVLEVNSPLSLELAETRGVALPSVARRIERFIVASADLVCVVSEQLRDIVVELGANRDRIFVTPNGIDLELYPYPPPVESRTRSRSTILGDRGESPASDLILAGFVGHFRDWHRLDLLLEAVAGTATDRIHLVVIGDGANGEELRRQAESLGIAHRVHWLGPRPPETVPELLTALDIAVISGIPPYACPLKLIEYMAAGLPTVAPAQANIRDLVGDRESALLFHPGDTKTLIASLQEMAADHELRDRLGRAARATVEGRQLTWRHNARRVVEAVHELKEAPTRSARFDR